ncbi:large ribosomal subunit protein uL30y-like [Wolffia australiana]
MASEDPQPLSYIPETVLKKRRSNEGLALRRKGYAEAKKRSAKERSNNLIKKPEDFVKEFRSKELDLVQMKHRTKAHRSSLNYPESNLLFVIRTHGAKDMHPRTKKVLHLLRLRHIYDGVFLKVSEGTMNMLLTVEPFVTYGSPNLKSVRELIFKKGSGRINKQRVPLTDNNIIEQALGNLGVICIEDIVHQIATVGPHFKEVTSFLAPFKLKRPDGFLQKKKKPFKDGGDSGDRKGQINDLIAQMN